jgi:NAD+ synthase
MIKNIPDLLNHMYTEIKANVPKAIIGLSGGADSTLAALLCKDALGANNVVGISMPYGDIDAETFNKRSTKFAKDLGIEHYTTPIKAAVDAITPGILNSTLLMNGNTRARVRMTCLYNYAAYFNGRVINTCNLSESFIGYETKGGDGAGDFAPIAQLYKSEVYQLLDWYKYHGLLDEADIDRNPSAGLWSGQTDAAEIGYTYNAMEPVMRDLLCNSRGLSKGIILPSNFEPLSQFCYKKYWANKHKQMNIPCINIKDFVD